MPRLRCPWRPWLHRSIAAFQHHGALDLGIFLKAPWQAVGVDGEPLAHVQVSRSWRGSTCQSTASNTGRQPVRIKHIVLFDVAHSLPRDTALYGEGFQMLTQTGGTLGQPLDLGNYTDPKHYRLPEPSEHASSTGWPRSRRPKVRTTSSPSIRADDSMARCTFGRRRSRSSSKPKG